MVKCLTLSLEVGHKKWDKFKLKRIVHSQLILKTSWKSLFVVHYTEDFTLIYMITQKICCDV